MHTTHFTTGEVARRYGAPEWAVRRAVDAAGCAVRVGQYHAVPVDQVHLVLDELRRMGHLPEREAVSV
jgi:hypothetical protein